MIKQIAAIGLALGMMGSANAALHSRAGGTMVYDDVLNITWLADWNYPYTSGYTAINNGGNGSTQINANSGTMGWNAAKTWVENLEYGGFNDWRLPKATNQDGSGPDALWFAKNSELGYMFYTNWGAEWGSLWSTGSNTANINMFVNVGDLYWSGTESLDPGNVWVYYTLIGSQFKVNKEQVGMHLFSVAVRDGDVAPVPVPATLALLGLGLIGIARQRSSRSTGKGAAR